MALLLDLMFFFVLGSPMVIFTAYSAKLLSDWRGIGLSASITFGLISFAFTYFAITAMLFGDDVYFALPVLGGISTAVLCGTLVTAAAFFFFTQSPIVCIGNLIGGALAAFVMSTMDPPGIDSPHPIVRLFIATMLWHGGTLGGLLIWRRRIERGTPQLCCAKCGYSLVGIRSNTCPECGAWFNWERLFRQVDEQKRKEKERQRKETLKAQKRAARGHKDG